MFSAVGKFLHRQADMENINITSVVVILWGSDPLTF